MEFTALRPGTPNRVIPRRPGTGEERGETLGP